MFIELLFHLQSELVVSFIVNYFVAKPKTSVAFVTFLVAMLSPVSILKFMYIIVQYASLDVSFLPVQQPCHITGLYIV